MPLPALIPQPQKCNGVAALAEGFQAVRFNLAVFESLSSGRRIKIS